MKHTVLLATLIVAAACGIALAEDEAAPDVMVKEYRVRADNWSFIPDKISVQQGTKVVLKIRSYDAPHRFDLKAYGLKVPLPQDETTTVEFLADKVGKFKWRCGRPCGDGCPKMRGTLFVVEAPPAAGDAG